MSIPVFPNLKYRWTMKSPLKWGLSVMFKSNEPKLYGKSRYKLCIAIRNTKRQFCTKLESTITTQNPINCGKAGLLEQVTKQSGSVASKQHVPPWWAQCNVYLFWTDGQSIYVTCSRSLACTCISLHRHGRKIGLPGSEPWKMKGTGGVYDHACLHGPAIHPLKVNLELSWDSTGKRSRD